MPTIKSLEDQALSLSAKQASLVEDDSRPWSEKKDEYDKMDADIKAILEQHTALKATSSVVAQFQSTHADDKSDATPKSMGEQFVDSKAFQSMAAGSGQRTSGGVDIKTTLTLSGAAGVVYPQYSTQVVPLRFQRLMIADLLPSGQVSGGSLIYPVEATFTNAAATVAEGAAKPASALTYTNVTENLHKIAHTIKISDETLMDALAIRSMVDARMVFGVQVKEEQQIYGGTGSGSQLTGITQRSGLQTAQAKGTDAGVDAIFKQITNIRKNAFLEPDGIVMHPTDWQNIRLTTDSNGQYYAGGPFSGAYGNGQPSLDNLWGLRVVVTTAATAGTALVGAWAQSAQLFRKGGLTVEETNSNEDDFLNNLVAIRAEERILLAVYYPAGFGTVTGL